MRGLPLPPRLVVAAGLLISYFWRPRAQECCSAPVVQQYRLQRHHRPPQHWLDHSGPHWAIVGHSGLQLNFLPEFFSPKILFTFYSALSVGIAAPITAPTVQASR